MRNIKAELKNEILQEIGNLPNVQNPRDLHSQISSCLREERERENRKLNLCIHNFPEQLNASIQEDTSQLAKFLAEKLELPENYVRSSISSTRRIGVVRDRPRSTIVKFHEPRMRRNILQSSFKLKSFVTDSNKKIFILPDMTPQQVEQNKKLNDLLWIRRRAGENVTIKHGEIIVKSSFNRVSSTEE